MLKAYDAIWKDYSEIRLGNIFFFFTHMSTVIIENGYEQEKFGRSSRASMHEDGNPYKSKKY